MMIFKTLLVLQQKVSFCKFIRNESRFFLACQRKKIVIPVSSFIDKLIIKDIFHYFIIILLLFSYSCSDTQQEGKRDKSLTFFDKPKNETLPFFRGKDFEPYWTEKGKVSYESKKVDFFEFTNQRDEKFGIENLKNKLTVVSFFFARCHGICPNIVRNIKFVQNEYSNDPNVQIISFSVTPDLDTPSELRKFAGEKGIIDSKWSLLTGEREKIFEIARNTFQADTDAATKKVEEKDFVHSERVFLIDKNLNFRGVYNGNKGDSIQTLIEDIKILEKEG
jgi:protein SCO1